MDPGRFENLRPTLLASHACAALVGWCAVVAGDEVFGLFPRWSDAATVAEALGKRFASVSVLPIAVLSPLAEAQA